GHRSDAGLARRARHASGRAVRAPQPDREPAGLHAFRARPLLRLGHHAPGADPAALDRPAAAARGGWHRGGCPLRSLERQGSQLRKPHIACLLLFISSACVAAPRLEDIRLPPGFRISVYAEGLEQARSLALGERGTLFVGTSAGTVYAVPPGGRRAVAVARNLQAPHGVAVRGGALYV